MNDHKDTKTPSGISAWLRFWCSAAMLLLVIYLGFYYRTCTYLVRQGKGQLKILMEAKPLSECRDLSRAQMENLSLIDSIKKFSVDSLGYDPTSNYEKLYDHGSEPLLWLVTASRPYSLQPVYWTFPIVGRVSYKGFFDKQLASGEYEYLRRQGNDVEVAPVIAYSSLGWFSDPVYSGMLERGKGQFCNLLFHELFHATYYEAGKVNLNENLASFIAHKATLQFLANDSSALRNYLSSHHDHEMIREYLRRQYKRLNDFYESDMSFNEREIQKSELFRQIADSLYRLPVYSPKRVKSRASQVISAKNAYFVGFGQYESLQDSLENVFNKFYRRSVRNLVHHLKRR